MQEQRIKQKIDLEQFKKFMENKSNNPCYICGERNWTITDKFFELREFNNGDLIIGGNNDVIPLVPMICTSCGNTILFNAVISGFLK